MLWCDLNVLLIPRGTSTTCVDYHLDTCTGFSAAEDEEEDDISEESPPEHPSVFSCLPASLECLADTSDSCFLQFESCPMESWFITPPPCFTAGGLTTIKVETSPMENLLIEHPSMSVYAVHDPCTSLGEAHCGTEEFLNPGSPRWVMVWKDELIWDFQNISSSMARYVMESCLICNILLLNGKKRLAFLLSILEYNSGTL